MILGVDPGLTGALAWLDDNGRLVDACDMPTVDGQVNCAELAGIIRGLTPRLAAVERVHSMPGQGVSSTFKFGTSYGAILGVLGALQVPVRHVAPGVWKRQAGLIGAGKDASRGKAIDRWPDRHDLFRRKKDHGRADAALIAACCMD